MLIKGAEGFRKTVAAQTTAAAIPAVEVTARKLPDDRAILALALVVVFFWLKG